MYCTSNYKYKPLDTNSFNSDDVDDDDDVVPLLKIDNTPTGLLGSIPSIERNPKSQQPQAQSTQQYHQQDNTLVLLGSSNGDDRNTSNDSDSILLNLDNSNNNQNNNQNSNQNNKQLKIDMYSRNIIRVFLIKIIVVSILFSIVIIGGIDYYNTDSDKILYGTNGNTLFKYYYIINICSYIIFLLFSLYLILYIISCSGICTPVREIAFFNMLKINLGLFALNILTKIIYCICLMFLLDNDLNMSFNKIPKYYNYIIIESISYFNIQLMNLIFINRIYNLIEFI